jgi:hypothetical protein
MSDDTIRRGVIREAAMYLARVWTQFLRPMPFDQVFYVGAVRVHVVIDEHKPEDTLRKLYQDEDDRIAD